MKPDRRQPGHIHILHLDDEPIILDITRMYLEKAGKISVDTTTNPQDAIRLV